MTDSLDLNRATFGFINPNTATYEDLSQIPFLSDREISLILTMRQQKPFLSTHDLATRIGLFPFESEYLKDIFYFGKDYSLKFKFSYDTTFHILADYLFSGYPILSLWENNSKIYFMSSVRSKYITLMQGYIEPVFRGGLLTDYSYIPRKNGIRRDTSYNFILSMGNILFFNSPHCIATRILFKGLEFKALSDSSKRHIRGYSLTIRGKSSFIEGGIKEKNPVFYTSFNQGYRGTRVFCDIYSKYTNHRIYGSHLYARTGLIKNLSLKIYGSYRHSFYTSMRLSVTMQYKIPEKRTCVNVGIKKLYSSNARLYTSVGVWGKNYMYFSLTKEIGTPSYMLRYSAGYHNFSIQYIVSSNDADYIFLDSGTGTYYMGKIREKFGIGYRLKFKNYTLRVEYEVKEKKMLKIALFGRIYH